MWEGFRRFMGNNPRFEFVKTGGISELLLSQNKIKEKDFIVVGKPVYLERAISLRNVRFERARNNFFFDEFYREIMLKDAADSLKLVQAPLVDAIVISPFSYLRNPFRKNNESSFIAYRLGVQFLSKGNEGRSGFLEDGVFSDDRAFGYDKEIGILFNESRDPFAKRVQVRVYESEYKGDESRGAIMGRVNWSNRRVQKVFNKRLSEKVNEAALKLSKINGEIQAVKLSPLGVGPNYFSGRTGQRGFCVAVSYLF